MSRSSRDHSRPRNGKSALARWGTIVGGSALAVYGISRRSKTGAALAAAGGALAVGGSRINGSTAERHAEASFTVNVPPEEAYRYWSNFENLPRFMSHVESVRLIGDRRAEWTVRGPLNTRLKWTSEIVDKRENQWIVWRSEPNSPVSSNGSVQFRRAPGNRGTEVTVAIDFRIPGGAAGKAIGSIFGKNPSLVIREQLHHFKQLMEAGEIPTTDGQPHGRRSAVIKARNAILRGKRPKGTREVRPTFQHDEVVA